MAPPSSTLVWKIPWTEEPDRLQSMGSQRVGHDWVTSFSLFTFMHWKRKWQPTPVFFPGESQGRGSRVDCCLWGVQSWTRLKRLSSSSSNKDCLQFCYLICIKCINIWVSAKRSAVSRFFGFIFQKGIPRSKVWELLHANLFVVVLTA